MSVTGQQKYKKEAEIGAPLDEIPATCDVAGGGEG
jgi:hypothetical protein